MPETTADRVKKIASHLGDAEEDVLEMHIEDAGEELAGTALEGNERAERYLAAHFATLNQRRAARKTVGDVTLQYDEQTGTGLEATEYGQEVQRMFKNKQGPGFGLLS